MNLSHVVLIWFWKGFPSETFRSVTLAIRLFPFLSYLRFQHIFFYFCIHFIGNFKILIQEISKWLDVLMPLQSLGSVLPDILGGNFSTNVFLACFSSADGVPNISKEKCFASPLSVQRLATDLGLGGRNTLVHLLASNTLSFSTQTHSCGLNSLPATPNRIYFLYSC